MMKYGIIEYYLTGEEHKVSPKKHKRTQRLFNSTSASTKNTVKKPAETMSRPTAVHDKTCRETGDVEYMECFSDFPRNPKQIAKARFRLKANLKEDECMKLFDLSGRRQDVLENLTFTPSHRPFYAPSGLIDEVINDCRQADSSSVFSPDTTYGTGKHYVTPSKYRSTRIVHADTNKPVFYQAHG